MSHKTPVKTEIKDKKALEQAAKSLGCTVEYNSTAQLYGNQKEKGEMVIKVPNSPYDVAVNTSKDGTLTMTTDFYRGHVSSVLGENLQKLKNQYTVEKTKKTAKKLGHKAKEQKMPDGTIRVTMEVN